jgi:phosphatidylinositol-3-phosphatase
MRRRFTGRATSVAIGLMLMMSLAPAAGQAHRGAHERDGEHGVRAALPPGAIDHVLVIDLENESESTTFGPGSPATYLNGTVLKEGVFVKNYYATGHASLDNYIAQISGQAPTEETSADCLTATTDPTTLIGSYVDLLPGNLDRNQAKYPGQVDGHGCIYPSGVQTIASQLDRLYPPNRYTHLAAWRDYSEDMGNQPTGRELGSPDPFGGLDCAHPALNGADNTNAASPATGSAPADQYATRHNGFMYFHSVIDSGAECNANVVPLGTVTIGETGAGAGGLHGADQFLAHWMPLLTASPAYRSGRMLIVVTFDEASSGDGSACCGETPGPSNPTPGFSPLLLPLFQHFGLPVPNPADGGGLVGAVLLNRRYIQPGSVDQTGFYNHYSALRSSEDLFGVTRGGTDGDGHLGFAAAAGLQPFGRDVFNLWWSPRDH